MRDSRLSRPLLHQLRSATALGWECCIDDPRCDGYGPASVEGATDLACARGSDPASVLHAVTLFRGWSPVYGWPDEIALLTALGAAATSSPNPPDAATMIAIGLRIHRLREESGGHRNGVRCEWRAAAVAGAVEILGEDKRHAFGLQLDRYISTARARVTVTTQGLRDLPLDVLELIAEALPEAVASIFAHRPYPTNRVEVQARLRNVQRANGAHPPPVNLLKSEKLLTSGVDSALPARRPRPARATRRQSTSP